VPANRIRSFEFNAAQLKTIQEVIALTVFAVFSVYLWRKIKVELRGWSRVPRPGRILRFS